MAKWLALTAALACTGLKAADWVSTSPQGRADVPASVVKRTREQLRSYLSQTEVKGIPLLDPTIDWDSQPNWPDRFLYNGRSYKLEITALSNEGPKTLRSRAELSPGTVVNFSYKPLTAVPNGIFPGATWSPGTRVPDKMLIWGSGEFGGPWKTVFSYSFYVDGGLYEFYWQPRNGDKGQFQEFDRNGKLVGEKGSGGCFWNGAEVSETEFSALCRDLKSGSGSPRRTPGRTTALPNAASPHP